MSGEPSNARLQRQTADAAKRLNRTTGAPSMAVAMEDLDDGGMGVAFAVEGPRNAQIELALLMLLMKLAEDLQPGTAEGCEDCSAAYARVSAAVAALEPGFCQGSDLKGRC